MFPFVPVASDCPRFKGDTLQLHLPSSEPVILARKGGQSLTYVDVAVSPHTVKLQQVWLAGFVSTSYLILPWTEWWPADKHFVHFEVHFKLLPCMSPALLHFLPKSCTALLSPSVWGRFNNLPSICQSGSQTRRHTQGKRLELNLNLLLCPGQSQILPLYENKPWKLSATIFQLKSNRKVRKHTSRRRLFPRRVWAPLRWKSPSDSASLRVSDAVTLSAALRFLPTAKWEETGAV